MPDSPTVDTSVVEVQTGRSLVYLPVQKAQVWLMGANLYTAETLPASEELEEIVLEVEDRIDEWLGRRVAPTQYTENSVTNLKGIALLNQYPVLFVEEMALYPDQYVNAEPEPIEVSRIGGIWRQDRRLYLWGAGLAVRVRYTAGLQPVPRIFTLVAFAVLKAAMERSPTGDLSFLETPYQEREVSSISLPGGLSKSFKTYRPNTPSASGSGAGGSITQLDQLLAPLERYRYRLIT